MGHQTAREYQGVVGFFDSPGTILKAMHQVKDAHYRSIDAFTPYPVHGLEDAQGLKRSPLPYVTFIFGVIGVSCAFALQYWTSAVDWPLIVGGKPFNSWPAFVPVMFELTVLFAGISTVVGMILFNNLPNTKHKVVDPSITRDRFAIIIDNAKEPDHVHPKSTMKNFDLAEAEAVLKAAGAKETRRVLEEGWM